MNSIGLTQTLDLRESPFVSPRGLVFDNTFDFASSDLGSQIEFVRSTARVSYYLPFAPKKQNAVVAGEAEPGGFTRWFRQSSSPSARASGLSTR